MKAITISIITKQLIINETNISENLTVCLMKAKQRFANIKPIKTRTKYQLPFWSDIILKREKCCGYGYVTGKLAMLKNRVNLFLHTVSERQALNAIQRYTTSTLWLACR